jgi:hypothetical protein
VVFEQESLTYHELNRRANCLAHYQPLFNQFFGKRRRMSQLTEGIEQLPIPFCPLALEGENDSS